MKLSIIIPVFNEEKTIEILLKKILRLKIDSWKREIVVIDDCSTDGTTELLAKYQSKVTLVRHALNMGKTEAIKTGLKKATGEYVIIQDADLEYDPSDITKMLAVAKIYPDYVIYGSRFRGIHQDSVFGHKAANLILTFITNILYGTTLSDMETCYKLVPRKYLQNIKIETNRFAFEPEITAKLLRRNCKIMEVPIRYKKRGFSAGKKMRWYDGFSAIGTLIKYRYFT